MASGGATLSLAALAQAGILAGGGSGAGAGGNWGPLSPEGANALGLSGAALSDAGSDEQEPGALQALGHKTSANEPGTTQLEGEGRMCS